jgi:hypothetical protein
MNLEIWKETNDHLFRSVLCCCIERVNGAEIQDLSRAEKRFMRQLTHTVKQIVISGYETRRHEKQS